MIWGRRLYFTSEGRCATDFYPLKNPSSSAGSEPWVQWQARYPLDYRERLIYKHNTYGNKLDKSLHMERKIQANLALTFCLIFGRLRFRYHPFGGQLSFLRGAKCWDSTLEWAKVASFRFLNSSLSIIILCNILLHKPSWNWVKK
jgi:hypothetical protein